MMENVVMQYPSIDWLAITPIIVLLIGMMVNLVAAALTRPWPRAWYAIGNLELAVAAIVVEMFLWHDIGRDGSRIIINDSLSIDHFTMLCWISIAGALGLVSLATADYLRREQLEGPEVYALYICAALGAMIMTAANDMIVLFLGLETLSIALYVLAASHRRRTESQESGLKYFILGGFASAFLLYGIALLYGSTGTTNISGIGRVLSTEVFVNGDDAMLLAGVALLLVGLAFKVAVAPFHFWTPDVYQGAPTPVTAFMASVGKFAAFAAMARILLIALPTRIDDWRPVIWVLAVLSVVVGSVMAVVQTDVKRMLAYSSISHAGFIMIGIEAAGHAGDSDGLPAVLLYLVIYSVLVIGTFTVVTLVTRTGDAGSDIGSFRGLGRQRPALALAMTVFLLAQAGMPTTSGFIAKFGVISSAASNRSYAIAIIAMVASVIAAVLYLRIMISMWMADSESGDDARENVRVPATANVVIIAATVFTLVVGVFPGWLIDAARTAASFAG
ncbi:MAG: NADH-quinone oxidoreductase subunit N [Ilumatobacteraceae bacterium]